MYADNFFFLAFILLHFAHNFTLNNPHYHIKTNRHQQQHPVESVSFKRLFPDTFALVGKLVQLCVWTRSNKWCSKVPAQIPPLGALLPTAVNKKSDWRENKKRGSAGPISLCSSLKIEHSKPNCCLETQIAGN